MPDDEVLHRALAHARAWRAGAPEHPVGPSAGVEEMLATFGGPLPEQGSDPAAVVDELGVGAVPGLLNIQSGRFFGWVMGGTLPAALGADWLVSAWDQNAGLRDAMPAVAALEQVAGAWILELLDLPREADVGFVTGATMANFTGLAAGRFAVLDRVGWDVHRDGLTGAPRVHVLVGAERHDTVDLALRYLGLGAPVVVAADAQGRMDPAALAAALADVPDGEPLMVCLQAGNLHSGAFDCFPELVAAAHDRGAWVHVDGAFGLWARATPRLAHLARGVEAADSWATDAHKTLNVTYDCGVAVVRDPVAVRSAMGVHASYLPDAVGPGNPYEKVPELSRRARGVPVWAALRSLGRTGVAAQVDRLAERARGIADGLAGMAGVEVLNDVVYTQVCLAVGDGRTQEVCARLTGSGEVWMSPSRWQDRDVVRVSVSNAATTDDDVRRTVAAVRAAVAGCGG
ncbi:glutamate/tyrosine decarboxylase-like PLP-dependent enzyme [Nocardioides salarius]|uniref:Glutamate/tyrosine decarboxylase-like PLP-dependent enzyme n=1 Tax=Nocardioides salarius TaxID=374513 RepID=A0ABS2MDQ2_9ACTN|nr:pyridoxal-dependent decarboxylase [Nocardioides salarius]MBM7509317.1 glutamate/tyrosine decarboxylase-like PLP-dependent enzyme [Nocardioides salarius]